MPRDATKPRAEDYGTSAEYKRALKQWKQAHGGSLSLAGILLIAFVFSVIVGTTTVLWVLAGSGLLGWAVAHPSAD